VATKRRAATAPANLRALREPAPDVGVVEYRQATTDGTLIPGLGRVTSVRLTDLWLEHQPRELIPEEQLQRLIAEARAQPSALLDELRWVASADGYYAEVLRGLEELGRSIASQGVLQPIQVVSKEQRLVVRDGHRRSLASLLAGQTTIPAMLVEEPTELAAIAHPLIVNLQREDLTAIEKSAALLRLALATGKHLAAEQGIDPRSVTIAAMLGIDEVMQDSPMGESLLQPIDPQDPSTDLAADDSPMGESPRRMTSGQRGGTGLPYGFAGLVRDHVCEMTGLSAKRFYDFLTLNRLSAEARALGRGLPERRLRPIVGLPPSRQAEILAFAEERRLSTEALVTLSQVVRRGDEDEVQRVMARLRRERQAPRAAVSWAKLLYAIPADYPPRVAALQAELAALTGKARHDRLEELRQQVGRMRGALAALEALLAEMDTTPPAAETQAEPRERRGAASAVGASRDGNNGGGDRDRRR
jgi:hypothetical protein